ncbi:MAG: hypothetical protein EXR73_09170 [Myxococcales bacterium]|nr:hypothetical protein [Myxococcales bacterium]
MPRRAAPSLLGRVQLGLERLYRIETHLDVEDFLVSADARDRLGLARAPREQLLVAERDGELELGLFVDPLALTNLAERDPAITLDGDNLGDFLLAVEGVSHFVYLAWRAHAGRQVSVLELELQAEVDKYVTCLLTLWPSGAERRGREHERLRAQLFERVAFEPDLDHEELERYEVANSNARAYAAALEARFIRRGELTGMLDELRRFYRLGGQDKLAHIAHAA